MDGEDLMVRRAAVAALGPYNGSIVVVDPKTGRLLTIVNQKLAYQSGFQPCSTIKVVAALAGLNEGVIDQNTKLKITKRHGMDLTEALAHSNNAFFSSVGYKLGYDRIIQYAQMFGLGEKAGLDLDQEQPGMLAAAPPADGVGMMTSFGEGIYMTPLELAAVISTVANGGTLYYLQHPRSKEEIEQFVPRVKDSSISRSWCPRSDRECREQSSTERRGGPAISLPIPFSARPEPAPMAVRRLIWAGSDRLLKREITSLSWSFF